MLRKIVCIMAVLALLLTIGIAAAEDYSAMTNDELLGIMDAVRTELFTRDLSLSEDEVFVETDGFKMYLDKSKEITFSYGYLRLPVILVNNTEDDLSFQAENGSVNGWDEYVGIGNVSANKKNRAELTISCEDAGIKAIDEIEDIEFVLYVYNMNTSKRDFTSDKFTLVVENGQIVKK